MLGDVEQINGREGETATLLPTALVSLKLRGGGFAPRHLNRCAASRVTMNVKPNRMENTITTRNATQNDYEFLYALNSKTMNEYVQATWGWDETWQQNYFKEHFRPEANKIIMLNLEDVGRIEFFDEANEVRVGNIQILPEHQNKGIGSVIMLKIIEQAQDQKQCVNLQVLKVNPARRFYERLGFFVESEDDVYFKMRRT